MAPYRTMLQSILNSQVAAAVQTLASIAVLIVLTRATAVSTFGQYSVLLGLVTIFSSFGGLNVYFYYRNRYPLVAYEQALGILRQYIFFILLFGLAFALALSVLSFLLPGLLPLSSVLDYGLWALLALLSLLNIEITRFYQSIGRNTFSIWLSTASKLVSLVLFSGYLLAGGQGLDLRTVLLVLVTAQFATLLVQVALDPQFLRLFRVAAAPFEWRAVSAGLVLIPAALFYQALSFFDRLSLSSFVSYETSGHYSLAAQGIAIAYAVLGGTIITLFYPRLVRSSEHGPTLETTRLLRFAFGSGAVACVAGVAAIFLLSPLIKVVFGDRYAESVWMLQAMCLVPLCMFVLSGLSHVAYLFDALRLSAIAYAIGCFECTALYYEMVPRFGVAGAVSATYISLTTIALLHLGIVLRRSTLVRQGDPVR